MTVLLAWAKARRLVEVFVIEVLSAVVVSVRSEAELSVPFLPESVPMPLIVLIVLAGLPSVVLPDRFGLLERTLSRARGERALTVVLVALSVLAPLVPSWWAGDADPTPRVAVLVVTVAIVSVSAIGPRGWVAAMGFAACVMSLDVLQPSRPVSSTMDLAPAALPWTLLALACAVYAWRGPRLTTG